MEKLTYKMYEESIKFLARLPVYCGMTLSIIFSGCGLLYEDAPIKELAQVLDHTTIWFEQEKEITDSSIQELDRLIKKLQEKPQLVPTIVCGRPEKFIQQHKKAAFQCGVVTTHLIRNGIERERINRMNVRFDNGSQISVILRRAEIEEKEIFPKKATLF